MPVQISCFRHHHQKFRSSVARYEILIICLLLSRVVPLEISLHACRILFAFQGGAMYVFVMGLPAHLANLLDRWAFNPAGYTGQ